jgi:hypothetical protein
MKRQIALTSLLAVFLLGSLSIATAGPRWNDRDYNHRPNYQGDFTNSEAWSGKIVDIRGDRIQVVRYGERISLKITQGRPRLFIGERIRVVPFRRDGRAEVGELRLAQAGFAPVGVVRYVERAVPKEGPRVYYGPTYRGDSRIGLNIGKRGNRTNVRIDARWRDGKQPRYRR